MISASFSTHFQMQQTLWLCQRIRGQQIQLSRRTIQRREPTTRHQFFPQSRRGVYRLLRIDCRCLDGGASLSKAKSGKTIAISKFSPGCTKTSAYSIGTKGHGAISSTEITAKSFISRVKTGRTKTIAPAYQPICRRFNRTQSIEQIVRAVWQIDTVRADRHRGFFHDSHADYWFNYRGCLSRRTSHHPR